MNQDISGDCILVSRILHILEKLNYLKKKQYRGIDTEYQRINTTTAMTAKENNKKNS